MQLGSVAVVDNLCPHKWLIYDQFELREDRSKIACRSGKIFILLTRVNISNTILSIAGSNHQSHDKLVDISRGTQYSFMGFSALLCAQSFPVRYCRPNFNQRRQDALDSQSVLVTETLSWFIYQVKLTGQFSHLVRSQNKISCPLGPQNHLLMKELRDHPFRKVISKKLWRHKLFWSNRP